MESGRNRVRRGPAFEFKSDRFVGNAVLEDILNDPDTGTKKLKKHSDPDAVRLVQEALYDLIWARPFPDQPAGSYPSRARFVDGDYGPVTSGTVEDYKRHYRIVYPPDDPDGFIDGFTGPRTLQRLDPQISFLDVARDEIVAKVGALQESGLAIRLLSIENEPPPLRPMLGSGKAVSWFAFVGPDPDTALAGEVVDGFGLGAFEVHGAIYVQWLDTGGAAGPFGCPLSDVSPAADGGESVVFEGGTISVGADGVVALEPRPTALTETDDSVAII